MMIYLTEREMEALEKELARPARVLPELKTLLDSAPSWAE